MTGKTAEAKLTPRTKPELISLIISIALVAGVVGLVFAAWLNPSKTPARFRIDRGAIRNAGSQYYLPITITNEGDSTGAEVTVEGRVIGSSNEQVSATTFDFIPAHSSVEGILIFDTEPTSAQLRVVSYQQP
jgi:uncharacterized protein (TIGR02588 family)